MTFKKIVLLFICLSIPLSLSGIAFTLFNGPYDIQLGPEVYYLERNKEGGSTQNGVLYGVHGKFERQIPGKFYWAVDGYIARGILHGKNALKNPLKSTLTESEIEGRFGFCFHKKIRWCISFTPYVSYGYFRCKNAFTHPSPIFVTYTDSFDYVGGGFLAKMALTSSFSLGAEFKANYMLEGNSRTRGDPGAQNAKVVVESKMQYEAAIPLKWSYQIDNKCLYTELVPFYRYRHFGGRENFPFNFIDTQYQSWGARWMFGYVF